MTEKRKLTEQETTLCRQGINSRKKRVAELERELKYFTEFNAFNEKWAKYLEDKEQKNKQRKKLVIKQTLKQLIESIEHEKKSITIENDQLKNGVVIKKMAGVN